MAAYFRHGLDRLFDQCVLRPDCGLDAGAVRFSRPPHSGRADRRPVCAAHCRFRHRAHRHLFAERMDGAPVAAAGNQSGVFTARNRDRAHLHRASVHRPDRSARGRRSGSGRGRGRVAAGRQPSHGAPPRDSSGPATRADCRLYHRLRTRSGRVRVRHLHLRQHADENRNRVAAHRHQAGTIRLRGRRRHRPADAGQLVCVAVPGERRPMVVHFRRTA